MVQSDFKLIDVSLQLLLHAKGLSLTLGFGFQGSLHGVQGALVVLAGVFEFLFLLLDAPVDFLADLGQFELAAENLVLFLFQSGFSLFKSGLEFVLLGFQALPGLLDFVDVAATLTDLVEQILDFIGQVLVLAADGFELFLAFLVGSLESEQFGGVVAALLLAGVEFGGEVIDLELPFSDDLVEGLLFLLGGVGDGSGAVNLELQVFDFGGEALLGLLESDALLVEGFDGFLSLGEAGLQFALGFLELFGAGNALGFVLGSPQLGLGVGLAELALNVSLAFSFFLDLLADVVQVVFQVAELAKKSGAFASFLIGQPLGVFQLGGQGDLDLAELRYLRFGFFQLTEEVGVLDAQLLLGGVEVIEGAVGLVKFALDVVELLLQLLGDLLRSGL